MIRTKATTKGTLVKLLSSTVFSVEFAASGQQAASKRPASGQQAATNVQGEPDKKIDDASAAIEIFQADFPDVDVAKELRACRQWYAARDRSVTASGLRAWLRKVEPPIKSSSPVVTAALRDPPGWGKWMKLRYPEAIKRGRGAYATAPEDVRREFSAGASRGSARA
jgi:hypothetical protein